MNTHPPLQHKASCGIPSPKLHHSSEKCHLPVSQDLGPSDAALQHLRYRSGQESQGQEAGCPGGRHSSAAYGEAMSPGSQNWFALFVIQALHHPPSLPSPSLPPPTSFCLVCLSVSPASASWCWDCATVSLTSKCCLLCSTRSWLLPSPVS